MTNTSGSRVTDHEPLVFRYSIKRIIFIIIKKRKQVKQATKTNVPSGSLWIIKTKIPLSPYTNSFIKSRYQITSGFQESQRTLSIPISPWDVLYALKHSLLRVYSWITSNNNKQTILCIPCLDHEVYFCNSKFLRYCLMLHV